MPATYQATVMRSSGTPILDLAPPAGMTQEMQRELLNTLRNYNEQHLQSRVDNNDLAARIASYELAYKMQSSAPDAVDLSQETAQTQELYGMNDRKSAAFGRQCLLARRLVERGGFAHACGRAQSLARGVGTPEPSDSTPGSAAEHLNRRVRNRTHGGVGGRGRRLPLRPDNRCR